MRLIFAGGIGIAIGSGFRKGVGGSPRLPQVAETAMDHDIAGRNTNKIRTRAVPEVVVDHVV